MEEIFEEKVLISIAGGLYLDELVDG